MRTTTAAFARAAAPPRTIILGQSLRDFTIGHAILLAARDNGFAWPISSHTPGFCDLIEAVFLCAHDGFDEARRALDSPWLKWKLKAWAKFLGRFDVEASIMAFRQWQLDQLESPVPITDGRKGRAMGTPRLLRLYQHLRWSRLLSEREALNTPVGLATWDWAAAMEEAGRLELCNDEDLALLDGEA